MNMVTVSGSINVSLLHISLLLSEGIIVGQIMWPPEHSVRFGKCELCVSLRMQVEAEHGACSVSVFYICSNSH